MKTIITYLTIVFLLFTGNIAFSQTYVFRVLANKGNNQVKRSTGSTEGLKTGATLKAGDQLIASNGAYIGLMHKTGKTLEVRKAGVTKVNDLEKKVASRKTGVAARYQQYVLNKINEEDGSIRNNYRKNMNATGAVSRKLSEGENGIDFVLPTDENKVSVYNSKLILRWAKKERAEIADDIPYVITIKNIFDEVVYSKETTNTSLELDLESKELIESIDLLVVTIDAKVSEPSAGTRSKSYAIEKVDLEDEDNAKLKDEVEKIKAEVDVNSGMGKIVLAIFYDENKLLLDALTQYEQAIRENPGVQDFQDLYQEFLAKNNMILSPLGGSSEKK